MSLRKVSLTAALALSMASTPVLAQSAAPLSVARTSAEAGDSSELRGGFVIPLIAIIAIILGILVAVDGDDPPHSP